MRKRVKKPKVVSFRVTLEDEALIQKIARRIVENYADEQYDLTSAAMDITACHANGTPLKLRELLVAKEGDFGHDVLGIRRYIDRSTGQLTNCFLPRFSQRQT